MVLRNPKRKLRFFFVFHSCLIKTTFRRITFVSWEIKNGNCNVEIIECINRESKWDDGSTANGYLISFRPSLKKILQD